AALSEDGAQLLVVRDRPGADHGELTADLYDVRGHDWAITRTSLLHVGDRCGARGADGSGRVFGASAVSGALRTFAIERDGCGRTWAGKGGAPLGEGRLPPTAVTSAALSPGVADSKPTLMIADADGVVSFWDVDGTLSRRGQEPSRHHGPVRAL